MGTGTSSYRPFLQFYYRGVCAAKRAPQFQADGSLIMLSRWDKIKAEVVLQSRFNHPNIAKLIEVGWRCCSSIGEEELALLIIMVEIMVVIVVVRGGMARVATMLMLIVTTSQAYSTKISDFCCAFFFSFSFLFLPSLLHFSFLIVNYFSGFICLAT